MSEIVNEWYIAVMGGSSGNWRRGKDLDEVCDSVVYRKGKKKGMMKNDYPVSVYRNTQTSKDALTESQAKDLNDHFPCEDGVWVAGEFCPPFVWGLGTVRAYGELELIARNCI